MMIANYITVVRQVSEMSLQGKGDGLIESTQGVNMRELIVADFFTQKRKKALAHIARSEHKPSVVAYTKQYEDYFGSEKNESDAETDEHCVTTNVRK